MPNNFKSKIILLVALATFFCFHALVFAGSAVTFVVSDGPTLLFNGSVSLPPEGSASVPDTGGAMHAVDADSALSLLYSISQSSGTFALSDLQYYASFGEFYLRCITPSGGTQDCDNWEYTVNGIEPNSGLDGVILSGGETVAVYFGSPYVDGGAPSGGLPVMINNTPTGVSSVAANPSPTPVALPIPTPAPIPVGFLPLNLPVTENINPSTVVKSEKSENKPIKITETKIFPPAPENVSVPTANIPLAATAEKSGVSASPLITAGAFILILGAACI